MDSCSSTDNYYSLDEPPLYKSRVFIFIYILFPHTLAFSGIAVLLSIVLLWLSVRLSAIEAAFAQVLVQQPEEWLINISGSKRLQHLLAAPRPVYFALYTLRHLCQTTAYILIIYLLHHYTADLLYPFAFWAIVWLIGLCLMWLVVLLPKHYAVLKAPSTVLRHEALIDNLTRFTQPLYKLLPQESIVYNTSGGSQLQSFPAKNNSTETTTQKNDTIGNSSTGINYLRSEKSLLAKVASFSLISVKKIMRQRRDVFAIEATVSFNELLQSLQDSGYSRVPVYQEDIDHIIGIIVAKDVLLHSTQTQGKHFNWHTLLRKPMFVPENKKIDDLLNEFRRTHHHIAIVVDEYGGTAGIITMEDILEELVGDIYDETDQDDEHHAHRAEQINATTWVFEGKIGLDEMYDLLEIDKNLFAEVSGDVNTLAGMILNIVGDFPEKDKEFSYKNLHFTVLALAENLIEQVQVRIAD
ncbi:MAG: CBS domain-containing protein [Sphingobacteriales bacterium]|nr:CBS domain-containing protein [Sphingobacteriales bacterium]